MYLSQRMIEKALTELADVHPFYLISFLTGKRGRLKVGSMMDFPFGAKERELLDECYKPFPDTDYYFRVSTAGIKGKRWVDRDYNGNGSQKTRTTTFSGALLHERNADKWGWTEKYVEFLKGKLTKPISAFFLAVWLYRQREWPAEAKPANIRDMFLSEFHITPEEKAGLFDLAVPDVRSGELLQSEPMTWAQLKRIIGSPPDAKPDEGAVLTSLRLLQVGPAREFEYKPADRLNIITGDNSLGKTFILEAIWWALTSEWLLGQAVVPRRNVSPKDPRIEFTIGTEGGVPESFSVQYDWAAQKWQAIGTRSVLPGLVIYARFDGSFAVWDPARVTQMKADEAWGGPNHVFLSRTGIWGGESVKDRSGRDRRMCNGLLIDWVSWQRGGAHFSRQYQALLACLRQLSPSLQEPLTPAEPTRIPFESLEVPTLRMPYGDVPVTNASAGVQRAIALAYVMVWAWHEHLTYSDFIRQPPQTRLVMIVDEAEAHLHPRWQRVIVPAVISSVSELAGDVRPQFHLATHSPLVMASTEAVFDEGQDDLHHLRLAAEGEVELEWLPFVKRGRVDRWLMSDVFGLGEARSLPAEEAIAEAKALQALDKPVKKKVQEVHDKLIKTLAPDDEFWPRWRWFAEKSGVKE